MTKTKQDNPKCVMCHKELGRADIEKIVAICLNPKCPNFSLLCIPEEQIYKFINENEKNRNKKKL